MDQKIIFSSILSVPRKGKLFVEQEGIDQVLIEKIKYITVNIVL